MRGFTAITSTILNLLFFLREISKRVGYSACDLIMCHRNLISSSILFRENEEEAGEEKKADNQSIPHEEV